MTNASSVFNGKSLNSSLLTGTDFLWNLTGLRLPFRLHRVPISADIEAIFMQILVDHKDRPFLRFLWRNNKTMFDYEYTRLLVGFIMCRLLRRTLFCQRQCRRSSGHSISRSEELLYRRSLSLSTYR